MMYSPERQFSLGARAPRFMRRNTGSSNSVGRDEARPDAQASGNNNNNSNSNAENERLQQFEEVMMAEAIRLSLAAEEERRRKAEREAEKEAKKEAKKREKEDRKAAKAQKKAGSIYGDGQGSKSLSSVSLGLGRRRGNSSAASPPPAETTPGIPKEESDMSGSSGGAPVSSEQSQSSDKGKAVDRGTGQTEQTAGPSASMPIPQRGHGPSHLRQTSNISSLSSSFGDSPMGSYAAQGFVGRGGDASNAGAGGASLGADSTLGPEPLFNFASMASTLGIDLSRQDTEETASTDNLPNREVTRISEEQVPLISEAESPPISQETTQVPEDIAGESVLTLKAAQPEGNDEPEGKTMVAPEVRLIPGSPLPVSDGEFSKNFEHETSAGQRGGEIA